MLGRNKLVGGAAASWCIYHTTEYLEPAIRTRSQHDQGVYVVSKRST